LTAVTDLLLKGNTAEIPSSDIFVSQMSQFKEASIGEIMSDKEEFPSWVGRPPGWG
jgi:hypothetical protein